VLRRDRASRARTKTAGIVSAGSERSRGLCSKCEWIDVNVPAGAVEDAGGGA
jgi:hypothetical protein